MRQPLQQMNRIVKWVNLLPSLHTLRAITMPHLLRCGGGRFRMLHMKATKISPRVVLPIINQNTSNVVHSPTVTTTLGYDDYGFLCMEAARRHCTAGEALAQIVKESDCLLDCLNTH